ncbi:MAG: hypothetical protein N4A35_16485 [Flavobacteriales bacterium]|jgi:hypothetical protein|nr:hypothetical protein [Flavobacteriales bacterium]
MKRAILSLVTLGSVLFFASCGGAEKIEVDTNMKAFMSKIEASKSMMDAMEEFGANPNLETDVDLYELKEPTVKSVSEKDGLKCYLMNVKHGLIDSDCEVCWEKDKVKSVTVTY